MFCDYLTVSFNIPHDCVDPQTPGLRVAENIYHRAKINGETEILGATLTKIVPYPKYILIVQQYGAAGIPVDNTDFCRHFGKLYEGWRITRLDLADNIEHVSQDDLYLGSTEVVNHYWVRKPTGDPGEFTEVWNGGQYGRRGSASVFMRVYDAREHTKGIPGKLARFGTSDFWRLEYEFNRRFLKNIADTMEELTPDMMAQLWDNALVRKGVLYDHTAEYSKVTKEGEKIAEDWQQGRRQDWIIQSWKKHTQHWQMMTTTQMISEIAKTMNEGVDWKTSGKAADELAKNCRQYLEAYKEQTNTPF